LVSARPARAQDVPGIEICTVEKDHGAPQQVCLQSNVDFPQKTIGKLATGASAKSSMAASRQIEALKTTVAALQKSWTSCRRRKKKTAGGFSKKADAPPPKDGAGGGEGRCEINAGGLLSPDLSSDRGSRTTHHVRRLNRDICICSIGK